MNVLVLAIGICLVIAGVVAAFPNLVFVTAETLPSNMLYTGVGAVLLIVGAVVSAFGWRM